MSATPRTAREEWARYWILPVAAAVGFSANGLPIYAMGPFMAPLRQAFGWSSAQVLSGQVIVSSSVALTGMLMGALIDRWGPRRVGLIGVLASGFAAGLIGSATGGACMPASKAIPAVVQSSME